jgi:hypothetical protein
MKTLIPCPVCDGGKNELVGFPMFPNKKMLETEEKELKKIFCCPQCQGKGKVPEQMTQWIKDGEILKDRRIAARLTLKTAAWVLDIPASDLSEMERGVSEPNMAIKYSV